MKAKWLINPFERIAGWSALMIGLCAMVATAVIGKINNVAFDGVLDAHPAVHTFSMAFVMQAVNWVVVFLVMWLAGICFSRSKIRIIDVAGTMALSRAPMLLLSILAFLPIVPQNLADILRSVIFGVCGIILIIWVIALMYNAFSISCHIKGPRCTVVFIGALIIAEIISKVLIFLLWGSIFIIPKAADNTHVPDCNTSDSTSIVTVDLSDIHQTAANIVKAYEQTDFDSVVLYFDNNMKKALSVAKLKMTWVQIVMTYGAFEKAEMENIKESSLNGYDRIEIPFVFKKGKLYLRLAFNKDGTVCGMFLQPS